MTGGWQAGSTPPSQRIGGLDSEPGQDLLIPDWPFVPEKVDELLLVGPYPGAVLGPLPR